MDMRHTTAKLLANRWNRLLAALAAVALAATACSSAGAAPGPPPASSGSVEARSLPATVAQAPLTDQTGRTFDLADLRGKTVVVVPFLTLCQEMCPFDTGNLIDVEHSLRAAGDASKVVLLEVSVDPGRDSAARLAAYTHLTGASWTLATEPASELPALAHFFGWYVQQVPEGSPAAIDWWTHRPLTYDVNHSDGYTVIDPRGVVRFATGASPDSSGGVPSGLSNFLDAQGRSYLQHPPQPGWTPTAMLSVLGWQLHRNLPRATG